MCRCSITVIKPEDISTFALLHKTSLHDGKWAVMYVETQVTSLEAAIDKVEYYDTSILK